MEKIKWSVGNVEVDTNPCSHTARFLTHLIGVRENDDLLSSKTRVEFAKSLENHLNNKFAPLPEIKNVIFNPPATIVLWADNTKTVVKTQNNDEFDAEKGLAMAISKKALGNKGNYYNKIGPWINKYNKEVEQMQNALENFAAVLNRWAKFFGGNKND